MSLPWHLQTQISILHRQLCVLKLFNSRRPLSAFEATESVTGVGQHAFCGTQERLSAAADPMKVMSSCKPILVTPEGPGHPPWRGQTPVQART